MNIPIIASHNVHHCESKEKILKEIIIANEGMNGIRHQLYSEATLEGKEDRFSYLPSQHLLGLEEMIDNWLFLNDKTLIEKIIFKYPETLVNKIGKISIHQLPLNYSTTKSTRGEENDLVYAYTQKTNKLFAYKVVQKTHQDGFIVGSRGSIGSSFIAYLCGITDLNPLPFYKYCQKCCYAEIYETKDRTYSCYDDYQKLENCPQCFSPLTMEGHNLPFETFFGWEGEKTPDIDLNFSGEYQRESHNYVRQLLGEESVYRIGTINTLSEQTAEIFYKEHLRLRKELNSSQHLQKISDSETIAQWQKEY
ncbi:17943_t:CDS:2 [Funneliformis geosporum]|nr:17943_t:CDS:2 [Funneliformis geosporum]